MACEACKGIDAGGSGFCRDHRRAVIADDVPPDMAKLLEALAVNAGVALVDNRTPKGSSPMPDISPQSRIFCICSMCGAEGEINRAHPSAPLNWRALGVYHWPAGTDLGPLVLRICPGCVAELIVAHDRVAGDRMPGHSADWSCADCGELNPPTSGQCQQCGVRIGPDRAQLARDVGPGNAAAVDPEDEPAMGAAPTDVAISVDVAEVAGARVVKLVLPAGAKSVAVALPPNTADALAKALAQQARIARSPAGLILPPRS